MLVRILTIFSLVLGAAPAAAIVKCIDDQGHVTYQDQTVCHNGRDAGAIRNNLSEGGSGLRPGERQMLEQARADDARALAKKHQAWREDQRNNPSFSDRKRIRELQMRKRRLSESLARGSQSRREQRSIQVEINSIDRQIEQIGSRPY